MAKKKYSTGRDRDAKKILIANSASAVGNLMLGKFDDWQQFRNLGYISNLETLTRKNLKAGAKDVQKRTGKEVVKFCKQNFIGMDSITLAGC